MKIIPFRDEHAQEWDDFCRAHDRAWFWHTSYRLRHALGCSFSIRSENHSFWIEDSGKVAAIAPLTVDDHISSDGTVLRQMSYGGMRVPAPVVDAPLESSRAKRLLKIIFDEIDRVATQSSAKVLLMRLALSPGIAAREASHNFLLKHGFIDSSLNAQVVQIDRIEEEIFADFQSNHQRAIRKAQKLLTVTLYDHRNITPEVFTRFQEFYFRAAGKVTRPAITFELLHHYLRTGMAVLAEARYQEQIVGYAATIIYKDSAYYLMGAAEESFELCPTAHLIHWEILRYLRGWGLHFYEMGVQQYGPLLHDAPSPKELNISRFKRGFGGVTVPAFAGDKYYCADHFRQVWDERVRRFDTLLRTPAQIAEEISS